MFIPWGVASTAGAFNILPYPLGDRPYPTTTLSSLATMPYATHVTYSHLDSPAIAQGTPTRQYWLYRYRLSRLERRLSNDERARKFMMVSMQYGGAIYDAIEQAKKTKANGKDKSA